MKIEIAIKEGDEDEFLPTSLTTELFYDSSREIDSISKDLDQLQFFQLSWGDVGNNSVEVFCNMDCVAIVVAWEHNDRQDNLINILGDQDWISRPEQHISWVEGYYSQIKGKSKAVFSKKIEGGTTLFFNRPANDLPVSVFVTQGG